MEKEDYTISLKADPAEIKTGREITLNIVITGGNVNSKPQLTRHHERIFHVFIIGQDLDTIGHIHPEDFSSENNIGSSYMLKFKFPKAGKYLLGVDIIVEGEDISETFELEVKGEPEMSEMEMDFKKIKKINPVDLAENDKFTDAAKVSELEDEAAPYSIEASYPKISANKEAEIEYIFKNEDEPISDLESFLGASMHVAVVSSDLRFFKHAHADIHKGKINNWGHEMMHHENIPDKFGPRLFLKFNFPKKGDYVIISQCKHHGQLLVFKFMIKV